MTHLTVQGLVVKILDYKENDRILTVFTIERGNVTMMARGVRKPGSRLGHCARLFYCGIFECVASGRWNILTGGRMLMDLSGLSARLESLSAASHCVDVASCFILEDQPSEEPMRLLLNTLHMLTREDAEHCLLVAVFELRLLSLEGFTPSLDTCAACGGKIQEQTHFSLADGGLVCCREGILLSPSTVSALRHIFTCEASRLFSFSVPKKSAMDLFHLSRGYTDTVLDRSFKKLDKIP